ncbi:P-loop containing nucleoside triphosphate hydrolase protein [Syncephalis pseudoplumigaleata]|uniref:P-loop containing nucleoside triphosphate hydrolase protein n=1 Tax=Syncephalis pseudoplumigaleata TaxID=1712513 RepID=A0A4P9YW00_9FUNG|nr:P-loop containing nucleoside triphosphate hydrolase protein [Syncephalis pseudoplumigaleata]|eukprot:RKP23421.1 P-loop containing nucleoside triphosphate hydrolase protein [Syncephalis pseudoplumigaleata]
MLRAIRCLHRCCPPRACTGQRPSSRLHSHTGRAILVCCPVNQRQYRAFTTTNDAHTAVQATQPSAASIATATVTTTTPTAGQVSLRKYQQECIEQCLAHYHNGIKRQVVSLPVGSGKTVIFSNLISCIPPPTPRATRTLVIAHREELLNQAAKQIARFAPHLRVAIDQGSRHAIPSTADVIVASVPSLGRKGSSRLAKYMPEEFKCIIIDEAHHAAAASYQRILAHFGVGHAASSSPFDSHIFVWGCSATVRRHDRVRLDGAFDYIAYHKDFLEMIEEGWLSNLRVTTIQTRVDLSKVKSLGDDFQQRQLANAVNTPERNELVVRSYLNYAKDRRSTLGFAVDIQHVKDLTAAFRMKDIDARYLTSETRTDERADLLGAFRRGDFPVLINCGILTEGTDIPNIDCLLMARPTRSQVLFLQMIGRGMRLSPNKTDCLTLDFVDTMQRQGLTTVPTLLGLDERVVLKGRSVMDMAAASADGASEEAAEANPSTPTIGAHDALDTTNLFKSVTVTEYKAIDDVLSGRSEAHIRKLSRFCWLRIDELVYMLSLPDASVRIEYKSGKAQAWHTMAGKEARLNAFPSSLSISSDDLKATSLEEAVHAADQWVNARGGFAQAQVEWRAAWRHTPASPAQMRILRERKIISSSDDDDNDADGDNSSGALIDANLPAVQRGWTKGQAADMLTRAFEGGIARLRKHQMEQQAEKAHRLRQQEARDAMRIKVGPWQ